MTMDPILARMALRQAGLPEMYRFLAYVEGYALVIGSLGVRLAPLTIARQAMTAVIYDRVPWQPSESTFPDHLRAIAHEEMAARFGIEARARVLVPSEHAIDSLRMSSAQIGNLEGIAVFAHRAAELMAFVRVGDRAMMDATIGLTEDLRRRLQQIAPAVDDLGPARAVVMPPAQPFPPLRVVKVPSASDGKEPTGKSD